MLADSQPSSIHEAQPYDPNTRAGTFYGRIDHRTMFYSGKTVGTGYNMYRLGEFEGEVETVHDFEQELGAYSDVIAGMSAVLVAGKRATTTSHRQGSGRADIVYIQPSFHVQDGKRIEDGRWLGYFREMSVPTGEHQDRPVATYSLCRMNRDVLDDFLGEVKEHPNLLPAFWDASDFAHLFTDRVTRTGVPITTSDGEYPIGKLAQFNHTLVLSGPNANDIELATRQRNKRGIGYEGGTMVSVEEWEPIILAGLRDEVNDAKLEQIPILGQELPKIYPNGAQVLRVLLNTGISPARE